LVGPVLAHQAGELLDVAEQEDVFHLSRDGLEVLHGRGGLGVPALECLGDALVDVAGEARLLGVAEDEVFLELERGSGVEA